MATIRFAGFGGPTDPNITTYNAAQQAKLQGHVDAVNIDLLAVDPLATLFTIETYLVLTLIDGAVASYLESPNTAKANQVRLAYKDADAVTQATVTAALGL